MIVEDCGSGDVCLEDEEQEIIDIWANGSLSHFLSYFSVMELSSPFLKILPYEVARGWVEGLNGHKVSVEGTANIISNNL